MSVSVVNADLINNPPPDDVGLFVNYAIGDGWGAVDPWTWEGSDSNYKIAYGLSSAHVNAFHYGPREQAEVDITSGWEDHGGTRIPTSHLSVDFKNDPPDGPAIGVSALSNSVAFVKVTPKFEESFGPVRIAGVELNVFDLGTLLVPAVTDLDNQIPGTQNAFYSRIVGVGLYSLPFGIIGSLLTHFSPNATILENASAPDGTYFFDSVDTQFGEVGFKLVDNQDLIKFSFGQAFDFFSLYEEDNLTGEFYIPIWLSIHTGIGGIPVASPFGEWASSFENTSGISSLSLFDEQGNDITNLFEFTNLSGEDVFSSSVLATPEPSAFVLLVMGAVGLTLRARRSVASGRDALRN